MWQDLQVDGGESLIWMSGLLNFGDPNYQSGPEGNLLDPIKNMERLGLPYKILNVTEIMQQYPFRKLPSNFVGVFAPTNGCINVPLLLRTLYRLGLAYGAKLVSHAEVKDFKVNESGVSLSFDNGEIETVTAAKCIITPGVCDNMYVLDFLPPSVGKGHKNAVVFTAGWAMKLVPLIGKILSQLVIDGATPYDISQFKITRKGILK
jgi:sarcosine oxidase/L-pipecolate oxidase